MKHFVLLITLILAPVFTNAETLDNNSKRSSEIVEVEILGLVCDFCARAIEKVFSKREEVKEIDVNLSSKLITITFNPAQNITDDELTTLIRNSGYAVNKIKRD